MSYKYVKRKNSDVNKIAKNFVDSIFSFSTQKISNNNISQEIPNNSNNRGGNLSNDIFSSGSHTNISQTEFSSSSPKNNSSVKITNNKDKFYSKTSKTQKLLKNVMSSDELLSNNNNHKIKKSKRNFSEKHVTCHSNNNLNNNMIHTNSMYIAQRKGLKEKKLIEEKIKLLRNHINALKNQEIYFNKKAEKELEQQKKIKQKTEEREVIKKALISVNIDKQLELEKKKKLVSIKKQQNELDLRESTEKAKLIKINKYKEAYNERKKIFQKKQINKSLYIENNLINIEKIRDEREKCKEKNIQRMNDLDTKINKMYQIKYDKIVNETQKLKDEMAKLENLESEVIQNLKNTKKYTIMNTYMSNKNRNQNKKRGVSSISINNMKRNVDMEDTNENVINKNKTNNKSMTKNSLNQNIRECK